MSATFICPPDQFPTVCASFDRPDAHFLAQASGMASSTLHEAIGRKGALPSAIKPVAQAMRICGPAVVVHSPGGDNLWIHRALYMAEPGDILVVHVSSMPDFGYWGEIMSTAACERGLGGLVIDGCVRDADRLEALGFPVFSTGLSIRGTGKDQFARGWINHPVRFGDVVIHPGDLIVGDRDGVVAVPRSQVPEALADAAAREAKEVTVMQRLRSGERTLELYNF